VFLAGKYGCVRFNPVRGADLPPEEIREQAQLPNHGQLNLLIENLPEPASTAVWLVAVACVRPEEFQPRQSPPAEVPSQIALYG
jgi:hypothetical protein